jgi:predicted O-methyltransferase YrrM
MAEHTGEKFKRLQQEFLSHVQAFYPNATADDLKHAVWGSLKLFDAMVLAEQLQEAKPRTILEVGAFLGFSSRWILEVSRPWGAKVISVDPGVRHRMFDNVQQHLLAFNRAFVEQGALTVVRAFFALPPSNLACFLHDYTVYEPKLDARTARRLLESVPTLAELTEPCDFYFIDGDHTYDATKAFTEKCIRPNLQAGRAATIVVHDAREEPDTVPAVTDCVRKYRSHVKSFQVIAGDAQSFYTDVWQGDGFQRVRAASPATFKCDGLAVLAING